MSYENSILLSIKKLLGIESEYDCFDVDIIIHVNSVFLVLNQLGVGPEEPFEIFGDEEEWTDFFSLSESIPINLVKSYMYLKVRLLFDPPNTGVLHEAMERQVQEFEWRLKVQAECGPKKGEEVQDGTLG